MTELLRLLRRPLLTVAGLSFCVNLLLFAPALYLLQIYDRVLASHSLETLLVLSAGMAIALALMLAFEYLRGRLQGVAANILADALTPAVTRILIAQNAARSGRVAPEGLRDVQALRALFSTQGLLALFDAPWIAIYVLVIWLTHPVLGITAAGAAVTMLLLALVNDWTTRRNIETIQKTSAGALRMVESSLDNAEVAQALGMADALVERWRRQNGEVAALQRPTAVRSAAWSAATRTLRQALQAVMLGVAAYLVIGGEATGGVMIAATILLGRALVPVESIVGSWRHLVDARAAYRRLAELLDSHEARRKRMRLPAPSGQLSVHNLVLRVATAERLLLSGISLHLDAGQSLGIIGPSGAGKSTLIRLLSGVWKTTAGVVRLDQADLSQWPREEIGPWIGYVPQDVELFAGTVAENIARLGEVDSDKVVRAARRAHVHEMILALPDGYDTFVDPAAALISPGQRQRIALARALYGDPKLVLLDEPNANLDGAGEAALARTLQDLHGEATVVVVTHRTGLIQNLDKLLVLEAGRATQYGPTAEVLRALQQRGPAAFAGGVLVQMQR